ncbi:P-loop containing nucleoside triphosphate hydrolase protein [Fomitopsis serialis]|uniref:P-loop containing nucleoside triphosphate hydrolase protein n=1 Tax=Fomitopsis serialis TaxID=139415 RepID=UPI0020084FBB|nr:P-loop containing nucleoside triphosphate hydrolase protein [Neoantrodia serialis]KAH9933486.1 P-loop containing nucleoside triphosphate hydrolase protein [Neoantrodia serialis]
MDSERAKVAELQSNQTAMAQQLAAAKTQELAQRQELDNASDEINQLRRRHTRELEDRDADMRRKEREVRELKEELRMCQDDLERERETVKSLKATLSHQSDAHVALTAQITAFQAQQLAMQAQIDAGSRSGLGLTMELEAARRRIAELEKETREAESVRRRLHNMVQELKGNIRVFCRVRPLLPSDLPPRGLITSTSSTDGASTPDGTPDPEEDDKRREDAKAQVVFPDKMDHREILLSSSSESATGQERKDEWAFTFDRVFEPHSTQAEVFEEISQLAQSCTDGYNVCVFAYGQTGSGKSFTMEGGLTDATAGMIPRAVEQVFRVAEELRNKGWEYRMEGQFLEIYNETINDLLGKGEFDKKRHEIKHDSKTGRTTVTDVNVVPLATAAQVRTLLSLAQSRRTVAATLMNERSSRSHSVFTLRIRGNNTLTGEACEGSLNLVDLAGSERLEKSGAAGDKDRLRETQNINKSLSALGDVVAALGEKGEGKNDKHIPYRNSKLTYLLQNSLSGNSKTLMVLNLSPLATHLNESLCSLRFATKVNNTTIGTAKKQTRNAGAS